MIITLRGDQAIKYVEQLGGSVGLRKYSDPIEGARNSVDVDEARQIAKADPGLIYFLADTTHPDHDIIMERINIPIDSKQSIV